MSAKVRRAPTLPHRNGVEISFVNCDFAPQKQRIQFISSCGPRKAGRCGASCTAPDRAVSVRRFHNVASQSRHSPFFVQLRDGATLPTWRQTRSWGIQISSGDRLVTIMIARSSFLLNRIHGWGPFGITASSGSPLSIPAVGRESLLRLIVQMELPLATEQPIPPPVHRAH